MHFDFNLHQKQLITEVSLDFVYQCKSNKHNLINK